MTYDLAGKAVALTGGSRGIGRSVAVAMAREGARLAVLARDAEALQETVRQVKAAGGQAVSIVCDVTGETSVQRAVGQAALALGGIDVFLNIAGITLQKPLLEATDEEVVRVMNTNLLGVLRGCRYAVPFLKARRGVLVNVASVIVTTPFPHMGVYACSKWAVAARALRLSEKMGDWGSWMAAPNSASGSRTPSASRERYWARSQSAWSCSSLARSWNTCLPWASWVEAAAMV